MITFEELPAAQMLAVLADDRIVEALRRGRTPTNGGPLVTLLARWRDQCHAGT